MLGYKRFGNLILWLLMQGTTLLLPCDPNRQNHQPPDQRHLRCGQKLGRLCSVLLEELFAADFHHYPSGGHNALCPALPCADSVALLLPVPILSGKLESLRWVHVLHVRYACLGHLSVLPQAVIIAHWLVRCVS